MHGLRVIRCVWVAVSPSDRVVAQRFGEMVDKRRRAAQEREQSVRRARREPGQGGSRGLLRAQVHIHQGPRPRRRYYSTARHVGHVAHDGQELCFADVAGRQPLSEQLPVAERELLTPPECTPKFRRIAAGWAAGV